MKTELLRAAIFHTPRNAFYESAALESYDDGGLLIAGGRIAAVNDYTGLQRLYPDVETRDLRGGFLLPGFIDTHVHFPQVRVLGALGNGLLEWLLKSALPEEELLADDGHASRVAQIFLRELAAHGTTTALVFGAHFAGAMRVLFEHAKASGLRVVSGLVMADRTLLPSLHTSAEDAYRQSAALIAEYHGRDGLLYAVTPRFALSSSEAMLEVCQTLLREYPDVRFQTHVNENLSEVEAVRDLFPWAADYLAVYEKYALVNARSVLAHNVHASDGEMVRLAQHGATVAHCPCSNAALGSGLFPMARHVAANVRVSLGTDVGAGTGFGMLKEALQAYLLQRLCGDGFPLTASHLLYLATRAGAEALGLADETGDFSTGKSADFVYLRPVEGSALEAIRNQAESAERMLATLFTLAGAECVQETWVGGKQVYGRARHDD